MKFYEIILGLDAGGHEVGRVLRQVRARSPLSAALKAENELGSLYGTEVFAHARKVRPITKDEFNSCLAQAAA